MADFPAGSIDILVTSTTGMQVNDTIEIMLDNNELFRTTIVSIIDSRQIVIGNPLVYSASAGNILLDLSQSKNVLPDNEDFLT